MNNRELDKFLKAILEVRHTGEIFNHLYNGHTLTKKEFRQLSKKCSKLEVTLTKLWHNERIRREIEN